MNRLKVLFLTAWYPDDENPVAGIFVREHAKSVSMYDDVVVLYAKGTTKKISGLYRIISDKREYGIRTIRILYKKFFVKGVSDFFSFYSVFRGFKMLLKDQWKPDIIHANVYSAGVIGVILARLYNVPVVITEHWGGFINHGLKFSNIIKARFAMNKANAILPVSKSLEDAIKSYGISNNFCVIPNVVDTKLFYPDTKVLHGNEKKILFVGLLSPVKGVPYLLEAVAKLAQKRHDFILDIIGDGPNRKEYENLTQKLKLEKIVRFHGLKTKPEVAEFMRQSSFLVQPSLVETFGVTFIEEMACGKPVVTTNLSVLKEIINEERGVLVPTKNTEKLAEAINYMLDNYQQYSTEKIAQYAQKYFNYELIGKKIDECYRKCLRNRQ